VRVDDVRFHYRRHKAWQSLGKIPPITQHARFAIRGGELPPSQMTREPWGSLRDRRCRARSPRCECISASAGSNTVLLPTPDVAAPRGASRIVDVPRRRQGEKEKKLGRRTKPMLLISGARERNNPGREAAKRRQKTVIAEQRQDAKADFPFAPAGTNWQARGWFSFGFRSMSPQRGESSRVSSLKRRKRESPYHSRDVYARYATCNYSERIAYLADKSSRYVARVVFDLSPGAICHSDIQNVRNMPATSATAGINELFVYSYLVTKLTPRAGLPRWT